MLRLIYAAFLIIVRADWSYMAVLSLLRARGLHVFIRNAAWVLTRDWQPFCQLQGFHVMGQEERALLGMREACIERGECAQN